MRKIAVFCDLCGRMGPSAIKVADARDKARKFGWDCRVAEGGRFERCPQCRTSDTVRQRCAICGEEGHNRRTCPARGSNASRMD